ncbi:MAG: hypothetical protein AB2L14_27325 [Candidatus Xenobiia bacterium LiM19]
MNVSRVMRYSIWDIVVLYCAAFSGVFALLELLTFFLFWILIAWAPHQMVFIPFLTRSYLSFQLFNNWGLLAAVLCVSVSAVRLIISPPVTVAAEEGESASLVKRRKTLLLLSCVAALLGVLRVIAWNHWPFIYW